jgi:hypothetical protein
VKAEKEAKMAVSKAKTNQTPEPVLSPEQRAIAERASAENTDWFTIGEESMNDFSMSNNAYDIHTNFPKAAKLENEKQYVFRWCERTPERVDALTRSIQPPRRWAIVNKQNLPELAEYVDPILGCVTCLDQMLLFKPYSHAMILRQAKDEMANAKARAPKSRLDHEKVEVSDDPAYKIQGGDIVTYEDTRDEGGPVIE